MSDLDPFLDRCSQTHERIASRIAATPPPGPRRARRRAVRGDAADAPTPALPTVVRRRPVRNLEGQLSLDDPSSAGDWTPLPFG